LKEEYNLVDQQLKTSLFSRKTRSGMPFPIFRRHPYRYRSASDAYLQKSVLYKNGLSNIVDMTQALYVLNRAETNRDIAATKQFMAGTTAQSRREWQTWADF
jgi:hypothetical protein